jgi:hypothetical protein
LAQFGAYLAISCVFGGCELLIKIDTIAVQTFLLLHDQVPESLLLHSLHGLNELLLIFSLTVIHELTLDLSRLDDAKLCATCVLDNRPRKELAVLPALLIQTECQFWSGPHRPFFISRLVTVLGWVL